MVHSLATVVHAACCIGALHVASALCMLHRRLIRADCADTSHGAAQQRNMVQRSTAQRSAAQRRWQRRAVTSFDCAFVLCCQIFPAGLRLGSAAALPNAAAWPLNMSGAVLHAWYVGLLRQSRKQQRSAVWRA